MVNQRTDTIQLYQVIKADRDLNGAEIPPRPHPFHCPRERIHTLFVRLFGSARRTVF